MSKKSRFTLIAVTALLILVVGLVITTAYYNNLPENLSLHETIVLGQNRLVPGSEAALRVLVRDTSDAAPLPEARIQIAMKPAGGGPEIPLFEGETNEAGTADVSFIVPDTGAADQVLVIKTSSNMGSDKMEQAVTLVRDYRILLTTDKPIFQPGQAVHVRALALGSFDLLPAKNQEIEFIIADGKGNKVFRKMVKTSEFGTAAADFQLANEVNTGRYKISAVMGNTNSEKTVTVEHYQLPKFAVTLQTEKAFYQPGEHVQATLNAGYFFGKPVAGGEVLIEGFTFDVSQNEVFNLQGMTDDKGDFHFEFDLPGYIAGSDLEGGQGMFYLQASVTDLAKHTESASHSFPVSESLLVIEAVPESGSLRPGVENIIYILTSYPNGAPADTDLVINIDNGYKQLTAGTGRYGLAEVTFTPENPWHILVINAKDNSGATSSREFYFEENWQEESLLLRPDQPAYQVGDTMILDVYTAADKGTVYLDITREGQTVSTRSLEIQDGRGKLAVDLTPDLYGTLTIHAYKILRSGSIARDTRLVLVDRADDLTLTMNTGAEVYRPGDMAGLDITVDGRGGGIQSAIGLAIVDESVFALAEQDPGFAKLYFMLEQELLQPKYDLHGFSVPDLLTAEPVEDETLRTAQEGAASASLSDAAPRSIAYGLQGNSHDLAMQQAFEKQSNYFDKLSQGLFGLLLIVPVAVLTLSVVSMARERRFWRSLGVALLVLIVASIAVYSGLFETFLEWLPGDGQIFLAVGALLTVTAYFGLLVYAWRFKESSLGWSLILIIAFTGLLVASVFATDRAKWYPGDDVTMGIIIAIALIPLAFLMRAAGFGWDRRQLPAMATSLLALGILIIPMTTAVESFSNSWNNRGDMIMGGEVFFEAEGLGRGGPMPQMAAVDSDMVKEETAMEMAPPAEPNPGQGQEPPRLRQYFPETMLWLPDAVTEEDGTLHLEVPVADSITTWHLTALASSQDGRLGSATGSLRVFQDFFVDLDLPPALTVGDEVAIPVGVFNYLPEAQTIRLDVEEAGWFELLDEASKELTIAANDIDVVYFRIRAQAFGDYPFTVTAWGSQMSDAIRKEVRVYPDGKEIRASHSDRLTPGESVNQIVAIPESAVPGTQELTVKIYPGVVSQVVEGLDSILRMPNGCFEQTSSSTYPNVLVLDYLQSSGQIAPEVQFKAEDYINLGYQRLATFEVGGGGFSLFGQPPADRMLTAYGLQEFSDMSRVHDVDPLLVERAARWLLTQQMGDGSWENDTGLVHENTWQNLANDRLPVTAYITWSLVEAGFGDDPGTRRGLSYLKEFQGQAEDPYVVALVANALVAADLPAGEGLDSTTKAVLDRLAGLAMADGNGFIWESGVATFIGSEGATGSIETTALAALAFLRANSHPDLANGALTSLIQQKDSFGTWYNTQATILALKALIETVRSGAEDVKATVTVTLNGGETRIIEVGPENFDVVQMIHFEDVKLSDNQVAIDVAGKGNLMYQVTSSYYLPWDKLALYPEAVPAEDLVSIDVAYDRTELSVDDTVAVNVTVSLNTPGSRAEWALIDLGIPPGFSVQAEDLARLVAMSQDRAPESEQATIERYELTGRQILVYIGQLSEGNPLSFSYRLKANFPLVAQTPASNAYDYYNPAVSGEAEPQLLVVSE